MAKILNSREREAVPSALVQAQQAAPGQPMHLRIAPMVWVRGVNFKAVRGVSWTLLLDSIPEATDALEMLDEVMAAVDEYGLAGVRARLALTEIPAAAVVE